MVGISGKESEASTLTFVVAQSPCVFSATGRCQRGEKQASHTSSAAASWQPGLKTDSGGRRRKKSRRGRTLRLRRRRNDLEFSWTWGLCLSLTEVALAPPTDGPKQLLLTSHCDTWVHQTICYVINKGCAIRLEVYMQMQLNVVHNTIYITIEHILPPSTKSHCLISIIFKCANVVLHLITFEFWSRKTCFFFIYI